MPAPLLLSGSRYVIQRRNCIPAPKRPGNRFGCLRRRELGYNDSMTSRPSLLTAPESTPGRLLLLLTIGLGARPRLAIFAPDREPVAAAPRFPRPDPGRGPGSAGATSAPATAAPWRWNGAAWMRARRRGWSPTSARPTTWPASAAARSLTLFFENGLLRNLIYPIDRDRFLEAERDGRRRVPRPRRRRALRGAPGDRAHPHRESPCTRRPWPAAK